MHITRLLLALPFLAYGLHNISGTLSTDIGYRFDTWRLNGQLSGSEVIEKAQNLEGMSLGLNGRLLLDNFYLRGRGSALLTLSRPNYLRMVGGTPQTSLRLDKREGYNFEAAFGYPFYWGCDFISLAPEIGFSYQSLALTRGKSVKAGTPFIALASGVKVAPNWHLNLGFGYHFLGLNRADIVHGSNLGVAKETKGTYSGTDLKVSLDFSPVESWSIGIGYQFKYLFTERKDYTSTFTHANMRWITNTATFNLAYTF